MTRARAFFFLGILSFSGAPAFCLAARLPETAAQSPASTPTAQPPIFFESDSLDYREVEQVITASGSVKIRQSSYTFTSDYAIFNIPEQSLQAWGRVRFEDAQGDQINSRLLTYRPGKGGSRLEDATGTFGPWIFAARNVERDDEGNFLLEHARLSTCETDLSKYHLYGQRIRVLPKKRLTVKNAVFRLGPVPILYLPYYYYSLGERHLSFQFFPGQNQNEGAFVRTIWGYPFTDETYLRAYLDYLSLRGVGTGGEFDYYFGDRMKGSLYGYRIEDRVNGEDRWNVRLAHWERLSPAWILQSNINQLSDDSFPNDFFREDFDRVVRDFRSSAALTFQKKKVYFRVVGDREDVFDLPSRKFMPKDSRAPAAELNLIQTPLGWAGIDQIASLSFANRFAGAGTTGELLERKYRREGEAQYSLLRSLTVVPRRTTFVPRLILRSRWVDRPQGSEVREPFVQYVMTQGNLRQRLGFWGDLDLTHTFSQRFQENRGDDHGREEHRLNFLASLRPMGWMAMRLETAHQLPRLKGQPLAFLERKNYDPLRGEVSFDPRPGLEFFFREEYLLSDPITGSPHPLSTQSEIVLGRKALGENYYSLATSYSSARDNLVEVRQSGRWSPTETWKIEATLRTFLFYRPNGIYDVEKLDFEEKEVLVKKEWRCWILSAVFRQRAGVFEFLFNLELQLDRTNRERSVQRTREQEWYPWRRDR